MKRFLVILLLSAATAELAFAQGTKFLGGDFEFADYLIENDLKLDARKLVWNPEYMESDSLLFVRGWVEYQLKELEKAQGLLALIQDTSAFYPKALFYGTAISAHLGDYTSPVKRLEEYSGPYAELKGVQLAGLALLRDDPEAFRNAAQSFTYSDYALSGPEKEFDAIYKSRYESRRKSPWLAAAASAVVPGLGKIYAGKTGEGISSLLLIGATGAITAEHWVKDGISDWKTIVPLLFTAALYIGNIYGSYMSVSIYNSDLRNAQNTAVLYNVHIPLRSVLK